MINAFEDFMSLSFLSKGEFRNELMKIIHNAEESNEEIISILKEVAASLESTI